MNKHANFPDDPRLTAYALGELDAAEAAEVESVLPADPNARSAVAEIRKAAARLSAALAEEAIEVVARPPENDAVADRRRRGRARRRWWLASFSAAGLAAACLVAVFLREKSPVPAGIAGKAAIEAKRYRAFEASSLPAGGAGFMAATTAAPAAVARSGYAGTVGAARNVRMFSEARDSDFAGAAPAQGKGKVAILIDKDNRIFFDGRPVSDQRLGALLEQIHRLNGDIPIQIEADSSSQARNLVLVLNACRQAHLDKINLVAR